MGGNAAQLSVSLRTAAGVNPGLNMLLPEITQSESHLITCKYLLINLCREGGY
jgi:hypothetical protein